MLWLIVWLLCERTWIRSDLSFKIIELTDKKQHFAYFFHVFYATAKNFYPPQKKNKKDT